MKVKKINQNEIYENNYDSRDKGKIPKVAACEAFQRSRYLEFVGIQPLLSELRLTDL